MDHPDFCCDIFSEMVSEPGRKGFSVLPTRLMPEEKYYFVIQSRTADYDSASEKGSVSQVAIHYCPWCGSVLADIIAAQPELIAEIEKKTRHLVL